MGTRRAELDCPIVKEEITPRSSALDPLRHPQFVSCFTGSLISHSANWMQLLTVPVVVLELTGSQTWLGIAALAGQIPALFFGPVGGIIAERYSRKRIILLSIAVQMLASLVLAAMWWADVMTAPRVLPPLIVWGIGSSLFITAWQSYVPLLVPPSALASAFRLNSVMFTFSRAFGPAIAGLVLARYGPGVALTANALSYLPPLLTVGLSQPRPVQPDPPSNPLRELADALGHARGHPALWIPILTTICLGFFGQSLHPLGAGITETVFEVGKLELGLMISAFGVTAATGSVVIAVVGDRIRRSLMAQVGLFAYALGVLTVGATRSFDVGVVGFAIMGISHVMVAVNITTSMQVHVEERFRARVTSLYLTGLLAAIPVGALIGGAIGDWVGLQVTIRVFGVTLGLYALVALFLLRGLRELDGAGLELSEEASAAEQTSART